MARYGLFLAGAMVVYTAAIALAGRTLITTWGVFGAAGTVAAATGLHLWRLWQRVSMTERFVWNLLCHTVAVTGLLAALFYIGNYALADTAAQREEKTVVLKKYRETRHRTKRLTRKTYARGEAYYVYYAEVAFGDGRTKSIQLTARHYSRLKVGNILPLRVAPGFFGVPVILPDKAAH